MKKVNSSAIHRAVSCLAMSLAMVFLFSGFQVASATGDLDGIGTNQTTPAPVVTTPVQEQQPDSQAKPSSGISKVDEDTQSRTDAFVDVFEDMSVSGEALQEAQRMVAPIARFINTVVAVITVITGLCMVLITSLDLLYLSVPPIRKFLSGGQDPSEMAMAGAQGGMGGGMAPGMGGMGGMGYGGRMGGMGYGGRMGGYGGGMGMGGVQAAPQPSGVSAFLGRWISDEAIAAYAEAAGGAQGGGMAGGMMGGMQAAPQPVRTKSVIFAYMKKRTLYLILMGVCIVVFTTTAFTSLGIKLGTFIVSWVMGVL